MAAQGFDVQVPLEKLAVRGYAEALRHYREILGIRRRLGDALLADPPGLFIGVAISFVLLVYRTSRPNVAVLGREPNMGVFVDMERDPRAAAVPGVVVLRPESGLYFANADAIRHRVLDEVERTGASAVVLDAQTVPSIDATAVRMLDELAADLARREVRLALARDVGQVRDLLSRVGSESQVRTFPTVRAAVTALTRSS